MLYRIYLLDQETGIKAAEFFPALNDEEAAAIAADLYGTLSDVFHGYELWQADRPMSVAPLQPVSPPDPTRWAQAHRQTMLDLEDRLAQSFQCIHTSHQLLETVDKLLDGQDRPEGLARLQRDGRA